jgi:hypothetical protein
MDPLTSICVFQEAMRNSQHACSTHRKIRHGREVRVRFVLHRCKLLTIPSFKSPICHKWTNHGEDDVPTARQQDEPQPTVRSHGDVRYGSGCN